jgi:DNA-binding GntR family transcriptional regulator
MAEDERELAPSAARTLVENAYATLRREILDGAFEPGAKLRTEELRARYNISGSTMREALTRLRGEALVTSEGQRGFRVAPASLEDFSDLTEVRKLIETEALRQSIARGDEAWESQIIATFYRLSKVEERLAEDPTGPLSEFEARNCEFHHALIAACPSRWLHHMIGGLTMDHIERTLTVLRNALEPQDCAKTNGGLNAKYCPGGATASRTVITAAGRPRSTTRCRSPVFAANY